MYKDEVAPFSCHSAVKALCPVFTVEPYFTICIHLIILIDGLSKKNELIMIFTHLSVWNKQDNIIIFTYLSVWNEQDNIPTNIKYSLSLLHPQ